MQNEFLFPAVAIMQDRTATYQAHLVDAPLKCFIGAFYEPAPMCSSLTVEEILTTYSCNCNDSWSNGVQGNFLGSDHYYYVVFTPQKDFVTNTTDMGITLQAFFTCKNIIQGTNLC